MIDQIEARLRLAAITSPERVAALGLDLARADEILTAARTAVAAGTIGCALLIAER
jgi:hypothetical protein